MKELFFCPDDWQADETVGTTIASRQNVIGFDGKPADSWQLADWCYNWSTLRAELALEPDTDYQFLFWLNGGENDRYDETCTLEIFSEDCEDEKQSFTLNRGFTRPLLHKNGWYLFAVPFQTTGAAKTVLRFHACSAVTTIAPAASQITYADLTSDPEPEDKPMRPNLAMPDIPDGHTEEVLHLELGEKVISVSKDQLVKGAKIAGGIAVGALLLRARRKRK